jgi:hypothetical protein
LTECKEEKFDCETENVSRHVKCRFTKPDASIEITTTVSGDSALGREFPMMTWVGDPAEQDGIAIEPRTEPPS